MKIAICTVAYNRVDSLERLLYSLQNAYYPKNEDINLIISIDKSDTDIVELFADEYVWNHGSKRVIKHENNLGLRRHLLSCGKLLEEYDAIIVLEDDIFVAKNYYNYALCCVEKFHDDKNIAGISLYGFYLNCYAGLPFFPLHDDSDVYLMKMAQSWGQIWMKKQWKDFMSWYNENNDEFGELPHLPAAICRWPKSSWLKYHTRYCIEHNKYFVYPYESLSTCFEEVGTHTNNQTTRKQTFLIYGEKKVYHLNPKVLYDGFMESINLADVLNIPSVSLCVDFYGTKENRMGQKFWLTRKNLPYKIIKNYGLQLRPYEMNIINNIKGNQLFLYDTSISAREQISHTKSCEFDEYIYNYAHRSNSKIKAIIKKIIKKMLGKK